MFNHFFITSEGQKGCNQMQLSKINNMQNHLKKQKEKEIQAVPRQGALKHTSARFPLLVLILNQEQRFAKQFI